VARAPAAASASAAPPASPSASPSTSRPPSASGMVPARRTSRAISRWRRCPGWGSCRMVASGWIGPMDRQGRCRSRCHRSIPRRG